MRRILLISCSSRKLPGYHMARDLYIGTNFKLMMLAKKNVVHTDAFILSAQHGVVELTDMLRTYDKYKIEPGWAESVLASFSQRGLDLEKDQFIFFTGSRYYKGLIPFIKNMVLPLRGIGLGYYPKVLRAIINQRSPIVLETLTNRNLQVVKKGV